MPDALSCVYSADAPGTIRTPSEYTQFVDHGITATMVGLVSMPVLVGIEAIVGASPLCHSDRQNKGVPCVRLDPFVVEHTSKRQAGALAVVPASVSTAAPAETLAEVSKEFARQMAGKIVIHSPRVRSGRGGVEENTPFSTPTMQPELTKDQYPGPNTDQDEPSDPPDMEWLDLDSLPEPMAFLDVDGLLGKAKNQYGNNSFFRVILEKPKHYQNFEMSDGYIRLKTKERTTICVLNTQVEGRNICEQLIEQAHSLLAHLGTTKTLAYLREHLWWKEMANDVRKYCESCTICKRSKPSNQKLYGLLTPLDIPSKPWEAIGIDFVGPLPLSKDRNSEYNSITMVIDLLTSMVHLIPSRSDYTAKEIPELVFSEIYKHHGLPKSIVSDRDSLFTSIFWTRLKQLIGIDQQMLSAYHPKSDGSTKHVNRMIGQML